MLSLLVVALSLRTQSALQLDADMDLSTSPISKVTKLLKDMQQNLQKEAKEDEELYEKLSCWCTTNGGDKKIAIETATKRITGLTSDIEQLSAKSAELKAQIKQHNKEVSKNRASIDQANQLRKKEHGEFSADEKELTESLTSVSGAVDALAKHHESFLQMDSSALRKAVAATLQHASQTLRPAQRQTLQAFLQQMPSSGSYSSRSGEIYGILGQMKETFESNLSQSQKDEMQAQREHNALVASKTRELEAGKAAIMAKTQELAETDEALVHAKHNLQKTRDALSADQKFLLDLNETCQAADAEYAERTKMRNDEIAGVSDAIGILTDDESRDLFSSTLGFVQKQSSVRARAASLLLAAGRKTKSTQLIALSSTVSLDAFTKVQQSIDEMVSALKQQMQDEVDHQRFCAKELTKNGKGQDTAKANIDDRTVSLEDMAGQIETLKTDIAALQADVAADNVAIKRASEDREAENKEFQQTVADQRATQMILAKVLARLGKVYQTTALLQHKQEPGAAAPAAPQGFGEYKQQASGGVMALIQKVADEASTLEKEALHAEQTSQTAYERFVKDSASSVNTASRAISAKSAEQAQLEEASVNAEADKKANLNKLEHLMSMEGKLHQSCDYVLTNFDARQQARGEEIDALNNAKAILSGADFGF